MYSIEQTDSEARGLTPEFEYHLSFERASQHLVNVRFRFPTGGESVDLILPAWVPGSYKIRDFVANLTLESAINDNNEEVEFEWISTNRLRLSTHTGDLVSLSYVCYANERTVRHSHVDRWHAFINPGNICMYVDGKTWEPVRITIDHSWRSVTTALSLHSDGESLIALNFDVLVDSPIEIGDHEVQSFEVDSSLHEIVITGTGNFDVEWLTQSCRRIVEQGSEHWGGLPYDRYVFHLQFLPGVYGGLEHARAQVSAFDANVFNDAGRVRKFLALLTHEFYHTWNIKRIRPVELGPFDYEKECFTDMLWLAEGATSYYDDLLMYRNGFYSRKEYLKILSEAHIGALLKVPGRLSTSIKDSSYLAWVKLYNPTPDSHNRFPSYYLKGGVLFLLLDLTIVKESGGNSSLEQGMRALWEHYVAAPERGVTEEEFLSIVSDATGVDIREIFAAWLQSTDEISFEDLFLSVGLEWKPERDRDEIVGPATTLPSRPDIEIGMGVAEKNGVVTVARVSDDSPASRAGFAAGDEVVAINGERIVDGARFKALMEGVEPGESVQVLAASEGSVYTAELVPEVKTRMRLHPVSSPSSEQQRNLATWLGAVRS